MEDILSGFDADFEPQSRPRSGTWPLRRPNIEKPKQTPGAVTLGTTLEESNAQIIDYNGDNTFSNSKQEYDLFSSVLDNNNGSVFSSTLDNVLVGSPNANLVSQMSTLSERPANDLGDRTNGNILQSQSTVTELHTHKQSFDSNRPLWCEMNNQSRPQSNSLQTDNTNTLSHSANIEVNFTASKSPPSVSSTTTSTTTSKAKSSRKNAWGNMSYADLITQAIEDSPDKRLTLAQIYEWMVKHIPYFKDKGDSNSSAGWKNSIRHNLSLHSKFKRIQNEGTGKSSWWVINHEAKPGKSPRRRAASMDTTSAKFKATQRSKAKQKAELKKQPKLGKGLLNADSPPWARGYDTPVSKALSSEFRTRTSSNASSVGGRLSPAMFLRDLTDDDGPISPHSGYGDMFEMPKTDKLQAAGVDHIQAKLSETSIVAPTNAYSQQSLNESDSHNPMSMYLVNQATDIQKQILNTPNLASLLQNSNSPPNRNIKTEPQNNQSFPSSYEMNSGIPQPQMNTYSNNYGNYNSYSIPQNSNSGIYSQQIPQQQYGGGMQTIMPQYNPSLSQVNEDQLQFVVKTEGNFPDDIDVDRPFFDSSDVDINQILSDPNTIDIDFANFCDNNNSTGIRGPSNNYEMRMDVGSGAMVIGGQPNNPLQSNIAGLQDCGRMNSYQQTPKSQYSMQ